MLRTWGMSSRGVSIIESYSKDKNKLVYEALTWEQVRRFEIVPWSWPGKRES